jgi:hypothetical protein
MKDRKWGNVMNAWLNMPTQPENDFVLDKTTGATFKSTSASDSTTDSELDFFNLDLSNLEVNHRITSKMVLTKFVGFEVVDPARTYISIWYLDSHGLRVQVMALSVQALSSQDDIGGLRVIAPLDAGPLHIQLHDANKASPDSLL